MRQSRSSSKAGGGASKVRKMSELSQPGVDVAKRAGRVGFGSGQSGLRVKRVIFKRVNRVTGQSGFGSG